MHDQPIVCTLRRDEWQARRAELLPAVAATASARQRLEHGLRFEFAGSDVLSSIVRMIDAERQCCRFLRFQLTIEPAGGPLVLDVTGPPGTREFLDDVCGESARRAVRGATPGE